MLVVHNAGLTPSFFWLNVILHYQYALPCPFPWTPNIPIDPVSPIKHLLGGRSEVPPTPLTSPMAGGTTVTGGSPKAHKKVTKRPQNCHQKFTKRSPKVHQKVIERSLKGHQKVTERSPKSHLKVNKRSPKCHQIVNKGSLKGH